jgi:hypothetical protein
MSKKAQQTEGLAAPQEFNEEAITATETHPTPKVLVARDKFIYAAQRPTRDVTIPASGGRTRVVVVVDKDKFWSVFGRELSSRASCLTVRPKSGHVLVFDKAGEMLAKYESKADARARLKEAQVDLSTVANAHLLKD